MLSRLFSKNLTTLVIVGLMFYEKRKAKVKIRAPEDKYQNICDLDPITCWLGNLDEL